MQKHLVEQLNKTISQHNSLLEQTLDTDQAAQLRHQLRTLFEQYDHLLKHQLERHESQWDEATKALEAHIASAVKAQKNLKKMADVTKDTGKVIEKLDKLLDIAI
ncbi:hypothetical protein [Vibrio sp. SCSIO 43136]|uniref:hypothetical protein n=1 Tax=Vibrio sp. SCSIO 43136 TaxID=2819101 RepID=UPI0020755F93|nr:hypothetical protein [Vibrio sp. SCSIO 43136]USD67124.1 hypothetical protein J4N39_21040 [Vibrio sp. SCSIO 43136]